MVINKVGILMGSKSDYDQAKEIQEFLKEFGISSTFNIASAHRTPQKVLDTIAQLEKERDAGANIVIVAVVGLSNALSGMLAGISSIPVVTCPIYDPIDINSNLRMPPGVAHATVLKTKNAALFAAKILSVTDTTIRNKVEKELKKYQDNIESANKEVQG